MEFLLGGISACGAGFFTNPLEVVKTRMQLQGELKARGQYAVHYRNVFHAFYNIAKVDGILALQKGLIPALWYQFFMNGVRLGAFQLITNKGLTRDKDGRLSTPRCIAAGAFSGVIGACVGSPIYMVKTQLQSLSAKEIAVGYQHSHNTMSGGLKNAYREFGVRGLFRGVSGAVPRVMVGSAVQLSSFSKFREQVENYEFFPRGSIFNALTASMMSGVLVVLFMTPFDVVSTRLYNQGTDTSGRGLYYRGVSDCFVKIFKKEGLWGFYKGWAASLFRLGPHTVLSLVFWDRVRTTYLQFQNKEENLQTAKRS